MDGRRKLVAQLGWDWLRSMQQREMAVLAQQEAALRHKELEGQDPDRNNHDGVEEEYRMVDGNESGEEEEIAEGTKRRVQVTFLDMEVIFTQIYARGEWHYIGQRARDRADCSKCLGSILSKGVRCRDHKAVGKVPPNDAPVEVIEDPHDVPTEVVDETFPPAAQPRDEPRPQNSAGAQPGRQLSNEEKRQRQQEIRKKFKAASRTERALGARPN